jgi:hypothetical protein
MSKDDDKKNNTQNKENSSIALNLNTHSTPHRESRFPAQSYQSPVPTQIESQIPDAPLRPVSTAPIVIHSVPTNLSNSLVNINANNIDNLPPEAFVTPQVMQRSIQAPDTPRREQNGAQKSRRDKRLFSEIEKERKDNNNKSPDGGKGGGGLGA